MRPKTVVPIETGTVACEAVARSLPAGRRPVMPAVRAAARYS